MVAGVPMTEPKTAEEWGGWLSSIPGWRGWRGCFLAGLRLAIVRVESADGTRQGFCAVRLMTDAKHLLVDPSSLPTQTTLRPLGVCWRCWGAVWIPVRAEMRPKLPSLMSTPTGACKFGRACIAPPTALGRWPGELPMSKHWPVALLAALWCMHLAYKTGLRRG